MRQSCCVIQAGLELEILLSQSFRSWVACECPHTQLWSVCFSLFNFPAFALGLFSRCRFTTSQTYPQCNLCSFPSRSCLVGNPFVVCSSTSVLLSAQPAGCRPPSFSFLLSSPHYSCLEHKPFSMSDLWGAESGAHWLLLRFGNRNRLSEYIPAPGSSYEAGL